MISKIAELKLPDFLKSLIMAITVPIAGYILTVIQSGSFMVSWHQIGLLAASGALGYLIKQMGTSQTVVVSDPVTSPPLSVTEKTFGVTVQKNMPVETTTPVPVTPTDSSLG